MSFNRRIRPALVAGALLALGTPVALTGPAFAAGPVGFDPNCTTLHSSTCDYTSDPKPDIVAFNPNWRCTTTTKGYTFCRPVIAYCLPDGCTTT